MKKTTKTIVKEYDDKGRLIKETETIIEEDIPNNNLYYPQYPQWTYSMPRTITTNELSNTEVGNDTI